MILHHQHSCSWSWQPVDGMLTDVCDQENLLIVVKTHEHLLIEWNSSFWLTQTWVSHENKAWRKMSSKNFLIKHVNLFLLLVFAFPSCPSWSVFLSAYMGTQKGFSHISTMRMNWYMTDTPLTSWDHAAFNGGINRKQPKVMFLASCDKGNFSIHVFLEINGWNFR